jgi:ADP-heptose:LPS heptosyltransferase
MGAVLNQAAARERIALILACEGLGDCLFAQGVIRKMHAKAQGQHVFVLYTHHPAVFRACPYVAEVHGLSELPGPSDPPMRGVKLFEREKLPHALMDTFDFISVPVGLGQLSFREKQLEYFPAEEDAAEAFDVVINTSMTWPSRSWPLAHWQRLANALAARGMTVAVVGKEIRSNADNLVKRSHALEGCRNLVDQLSLDQTYYTIRKARLFVSCQNGLSVLAGATDTELVVLDMSIEWSKRAIYRNENPFYKVTYVKGGCGIYCGAPDSCPVPENRGEFKCIPSYEAVEAAVLGKLALA